MANDCESLQETTQEKVESTTFEKHWGIIKEIWSGKSQRCQRHVFVEKYTLLFLCLIMYFTPGLWIRHFGGKSGRQRRKKWVEYYALIKCVVAAGILWSDFYSSFSLGIMCLWLLLDTFISLAGYLFLRSFWQNPYSWNRSVILLMVNFIEYNLWFSCLYAATNSLDGAHSYLDYFYFSIVTSTTVGFGDIKPISEFGKIMVIFQMCGSLFFLATVLAYFVSNMSKSEVDK